MPGFLTLLGSGQKPSAGGGGASLATPVYKGHGTASPGFSGSSTTFASSDIGTASSDRYVVLAVSGYASSGGFSATVNGTSLTSLITNNDGGSRKQALLGALVTSGTSVSIVVSYTNNACSLVTIQWAIITGSAAITSSSTNTAANGYGGTNNTLALTVPSSGVGIWLGTSYNNQLGFTSGVTVMDDYLYNTDWGASFAYNTTAGSQTGTFNSGDSSHFLCGVAFQP